VYGGWSWYEYLTQIRETTIAGDPAGKKRQGVFAQAWSSCAELSRSATVPATVPATVQATVPAPAQTAEQAPGFRHAPDSCGLREGDWSWCEYLTQIHGIAIVGNRATGKTVRARTMREGLVPATVLATVQATVPRTEPGCGNTWTHKRYVCTPVQLATVNVGQRAPGTCQHVLGART